MPTVFIFTDTQMFVEGFKGNTRRLSVRDGCWPFPRHDFSGRSHGRTTYPYSLRSGFGTKIHGFRRFSIILYSLLSFHTSFMWLHQSKIHISGIPIFRTSKGNGNWFEKLGVRKVEGGIKSDLFYRGMVL